MAKWGACVLTDGGKELLAAAVAGGAGIEFVRAVIGDGEYTAEEKEKAALSQRTTLKNARNGYGFSDVKRDEDKVYLKVALDNAQVDEAYHIREIGIFAREMGSGAEPVLYCIALADEPDYFPDKSSRYVIVHGFAITINSEDAIVGITENMGVYALAEDLIDFRDEMGVALDGKADKENPVFTGSFSQNRKPDTPIGEMSHVEGGLKYLTGAHGEIVGYELNEAGGAGAHAEGGGTIASGDYQHVGGRYNVEDTKNQYAEIIGGGAADNSRKNIRTLDWDGNAVYAGDVSATDSNGSKVSLLSLKKYASDGKSLIASAITGQGVTTAADAAFSTIAANINTLAENKYDAGKSAGVAETKKGNAVAANVLAGKTFTSEAAGVNQTGNIPTISEDIVLETTKETYRYHKGTKIFWAGKINNIPCICIALPDKSYTDNIDLVVDASAFGDALAAHVLSGKKFTSEAGLKVAGSIPTLSADTDSKDGVNTHHITDYFEISAFVVGDNRNWFCCRIPKNTYTGETGYISTLASNFGDAAVGHVLTGKKFTSEAGLKLAGAMNNHAGATVQWCGYEHVSVIPHPQDSANQLLIEIPNPNNYSGYYDKNSKIRANMYCPLSRVAYGTRIGRYANNGANDSNSAEGTFSYEGSNPITAGTVLNGKVGYVNGSKVTGNMPDYGAVSKSLSAGGAYTIPKGYHNGSGKVTAKDLAGQTPGNAAAEHILCNTTAWVNGVKISGSLGSYVGPPASVVDASNCGSNNAYLFKRNARSSVRVSDSTASLDISSGTYADYGIFNMAGGVSIAFSCGANPFGYDRTIYVIFRLWQSNSSGNYVVDASSLQGVVVQAQSTKTINLKGSSGTISLEVTHSGRGSGVIAIKNVGSNWTMHDFFVYVI